MDTVKAGIEQNRLLFSYVRNLSYNNPDTSSLVDLRNELKHSLDVVDELIARFGERVNVRDIKTLPDKVNRA